MGYDVLRWGLWDIMCCERDVIPGMYACSVNGTGCTYNVLNITIYLIFNLCVYAT